MTVKLIEHPDEVEVGDLISVWWELGADSKMRVEDTALWYDTDSHSGNLAGTPPGSSGYTMEVRMLGPGPYPVPDEYEALFRIEEPKTIYVRALAVREGVYYWTDEVAITITEKTPEPPETKVLDVKRIVEPGEDVKVTWGMRPEMPPGVGSSRLYYSFGTNMDDAASWSSVEGTRTGDDFEAVVPGGDAGFLYLKALVSAEGQDYWGKDEAVTVLEDDKVDVRIEYGKYAPNTFHIPSGTAVRWTNYDNYVHHLSFIDGHEVTAFVNASSERTFFDKGTYLYFDYTQPNFEGYVIVE
jgi:plastocyanin